MKRGICLWLCLAVLLGTLCCPAAALAISDIDTEKPCSLTLHYSRQGTAFSDLVIRIFQIAAFSDDGSYALTEAFSKYPVDIHGITSQKEWREVTETLVSYAQRDALAPTAESKTDQQGTAAFEKLDNGLYLVMYADAEDADGEARFAPFIVFLPTPNEDGEYDYEVEARPKFSVTELSGNYSVVKLWKDAGNAAKRPQSVMVEILKDGALFKTVELNRDNNWSYTWETSDENSRWSVTEKEVPAGYTVAVAVKDNVFTITNSYPQTPGQKPPETGDMVQSWPYILSFVLSGVMILILVLHRKGAKT